MKRTLRGLRPCDCTTEYDILGLNESITDYGRYHLMLQHDGAVILSEHESGKPCAACITIPRQVFRKMIEWYEKEQT